MKIKIFLAIVIIASFLKITSAQDGPKQAINVCAITIPVMNMYVLNYEYLYHERHGLATRIEYAPQLNGADTKGDAWGASLNYRWHLSSELKKFFVGPYLRYRYIYGSGTTGSTDYDFNVSEFNIGINGGYRWIWRYGINVVFAAGYGYSIGKENLTPSNRDVTYTFSKFKKDNDTNTSILDSPFFAELSFGYTF